jgi:hypothetical protein
MNRISALGKLPLAATGALLLLGITASTAFGQPAVERCPGNQTINRIETKTCPANNMRPAIVVRRACCERTNGNGDVKVHCKHFPKCPRTSPS